MNLSERQIAILDGSAGLERPKVLRYFMLWRDRFAIPPELAPPADELLTVDPPKVPAETSPAMAQVSAAANYDGPTELQSSLKYPCIHRTVTEERITCKPCKGGRVHTVCECAYHESKCTIQASATRGVLVCLACDERNLPLDTRTKPAADLPVLEIAKRKTVCEFCPTGTFDSVNGNCRDPKGGNVEDMTRAADSECPLGHWKKWVTE